MPNGLFGGPVAPNVRQQAIARIRARIAGIPQSPEVLAKHRPEVVARLTPEQQRVAANIQTRRTGRAIPPL